MELRLTMTVFVIVTLAVMPGVATAQVGDASQPLPTEARQTIAEVPHENTEPPEEHYYRSNEWRQDLLREHLADVGGALVGVGSDQNYTLAAMARSELVFLVDYDPRIPWIHEIYRALVPMSETPQELIAHFDEARMPRTKRRLREALSDHPRRRQIVWHWGRRREAWRAYLVRLSRLRRDGQAFSWLSDAEMYRYVRNLFLNDRIIARNGDMTATTTLRAVGEACRALNVPVRLVYLSNAEQFFEYNDAFVGNMRALPTDGESLVLRTIRHRSVPIAPDGRWHYMVQSHADFIERLDTGYYRRSFALTADLLAAGPPYLGEGGVSTLTADVPQAFRERIRAERGIASQ